MQWEDAGEGRSEQAGVAAAGRVEAMVGATTFERQRERWWAGDWLDCGCGGRVDGDGGEAVEGAGGVGGR